MAHFLELAASMTAHARQKSRARRFFYQMATEQAAIAGHREGLIELIDAAVQEGLLDLAWMNRLRLLDPLRGDARFEAARQRVKERADEIVASWRGPAEALEEAIASLG